MAPSPASLLPSRYGTALITAVSPYRFLPVTLAGGRDARATAGT